MPKVGTISTYESGVDVVFEWRIYLFNLSEWCGAYYCSPNFLFGGERWLLGIFPNGSIQNESSVLVKLSLSEPVPNRSIKQSFSLSLKTAKGEKYNERHFSKDFKYYGGTHHLSRFIHRSELSRRRSALVPDGILTVICTMKSSISDGSDSKTASAKCRHCNGTFNADSLSSHRKKCSHRPTKCPDCFEVVVLEKWLNEHECQQERPEDAACASGPSTTHHEKEVLHDFKKLFLQKEDCDVIIKVKGFEFPVHRFVLKARSPVFASTFRHNMKESATGIVEIEDCDPSSFLDFLCFLYCGDVGRISRENVFGLFITADKYEVLGLKALCLEFLKKNIRERPLLLL